MYLLWVGLGFRLLFLYSTIRFHYMRLDSLMPLDVFNTFKTQYACVFMHSLHVFQQF
ncbi:hypothetical protein JHK86_035130 [Glycine max]|nr:hypothetical protein JHK86_035130 [Glycine max]